MFITLEGIEGAGKSTLMDLLFQHLQACGNTPVTTREPGGSRLGRRLRAMLLDCRQEHLTPQAELCLFLADRAQHIAEEIQPALQAGQIVLCDRFVDSTLAYQGYGRGMDISDLSQINQIAAGALKPDLTLLLDLPPQIGLARAGQRNQAQGTVISEGRFDAESLDFHERVRNGYLELAKAEPERIHVIDASEDIKTVFAKALAIIKDAEVCKAK